MDILDRVRHIKERGRTVVYFRSAIADGNANVNPIGTIPAFASSYKDAIRRKYAPIKRAFFNEKVDGTAIILAWAYDHIDAVCFLSREDAERQAGFVAFSRAKLAGDFPHFRFCNDTK